MTRKELKEKAKNSLKGKWTETIKIILLNFAIYFLAGFVLGIIEVIFNINNDIREILSDILSLVVGSLLTLGLISYFSKIAKGQTPTYKELFSKTNMFKTVLLVTILVGIYTTLWSLLLIIPGIIAAISYSQVHYILLDEPTIKANDAIKKSKELMNGHKMDYFVLCLSFLGWIILSCFTLGIGLLWLIPYMQVTLINFYESIKK